MSFNNNLSFVADKYLCQFLSPSLYCLFCSCHGGALRTMRICTPQTHGDSFARFRKINFVPSNKLISHPLLNSESYCSV